MSYDNAVDFQGVSGHATLGLNSGGFFGIGAPDGRAALSCCLTARPARADTGLALGIAGTVLLYRRGRRPRR